MSQQVPVRQIFVRRRSLVSPALVVICLLAGVLGAVLAIAGCSALFVMHVGLG